MSKCYVGIDVSKDTLEVAGRPGKGWSMANDERAARELVRRLDDFDVELVVMEATGWITVGIGVSPCNNGLTGGGSKSETGEGFCVRNGRVGQDGSG
jgi:hypothetical protein